MLAAMAWPYTAAYYRARDALLADGPICIHCAIEPATEADHFPPIAMHEHVEGSGCCVLIPSCAPCGRRQGAAIAHNLAQPSEPEEIVEPVGFDVDDAVWDVAWLDDFRDVPDEATWPRFMSAPHPLAVGTRGPEFVDWANARAPKPLRWWQRLVAYRLLEVDDAGALVWESLILTLARQVGKSWLVRELCMWRLYQGEHFGEPQTIVHTARDLNICEQVQRPARHYAKTLPEELKAREANGFVSIERLVDGSRWLIKAKDAVYGYDASFALVDEAWAVDSLAVEEGLYPTMIEREQSQLVLVSSAHRRATTLMINRRAAAIATMREPARDLIVEWSTPRALALDDERGWRLASPHWTARRRDMIRGRLLAAVEGSLRDVDEDDPVEAFRSQWLNQWPIVRALPVVDKGERLIEPGAWDALTEDVEIVGSLVLAVEDFFGHGAAAAAAGMSADGRVVVGGWTFRTRGEAFRWASHWASLFDGSTLLVGASLMGERALSEIDVLDVVSMTSSKTAPALSLLRELVASRRIVHDGSPELAEQIDAARVKLLASGLSLLAGTRSDLLKAVVWASAAIERDVLVPAVH
jgi:hypothetical protein